MILRVVILAPAHQKNRDTSQQLTNQIASQLSQCIRCLDFPDRAPNGSVTGYQSKFRIKMQARHILHEKKHNDFPAVGGSGV